MVWVCVAVAYNLTVPHVHPLIPHHARRTRFRLARAGPLIYSRFAASSSSCHTWIWLVSPSAHRDRTRVQVSWNELWSVNLCSFVFMFCVWCGGVALRRATGETIKHARRLSITFYDISHLFSRATENPTAATIPAHRYFPSYALQTPKSPHQRAKTTRGPPRQPPQIVLI